MKKLILIFSLLFCFYGLLSAQTIVKGKIVDATTNEPISFVNVGVKGKDIGTVSNEEGLFSLKVKDTKATISIFTIGYEQVDFTFDQLQGNTIIKLNPKTYDLAMVEVDASKLGEEVVLGEKLDKKNYSIGFSSTELGAEIGALIKVKKATLLKSANFGFNFTRSDSLFYRVNLYKVNKGGVMENILPEPVIIQHRQKEGILTVDLLSYNLVIDHDVLLTLEWIKDDDGKGAKGISFNSKTAGARNNVYLKTTSFSVFKRLAEAFSYAPRLRLGFYLLGSEVEE